MASRVIIGRAMTLEQRIADNGAFRTSDTGQVENRDWVVLVDAVICSLTVVGASSILAHMLWRDLRGRGATVRTRLVQGLVASDLMLGLVALIPSVEYLRGNRHVAGSTFCDAFGVMLAATIWTEHLWTLSLAAATYLILIHPLSPMTRVLEKRWPFLWLLIWTISFGQSIIGYEIYGYFPSGGICYYGPNAGLYSELMQFIPRAIIFTMVSFFYFHLFIFLRRPDMIRTSFSPSPSGQYGSNRPTNDDRLRRGSADKAKRKLRTHLAKFSFRHDSKSVPNEQRDGFKMRKNIEHEHLNLENLGPGQMITNHPDTLDLTAKSVDGRPWKRDRQRTRGVKNGSHNMAPIPPWERLELPSFAMPQDKIEVPSKGSGYHFHWNDRSDVKSISTNKLGESSNTYTHVKTVATPDGSSSGISPLFKVSFDQISPATASVEGRRPSDSINPSSQPSPVGEVDEVDLDRVASRGYTSPLASPKGTVQEPFFRNMSTDSATDLHVYPPPLVPGETPIRSNSEVQSFLTPLQSTRDPETRRGSATRTESDTTRLASFQDGMYDEEKGLGQDENSLDAEKEDDDMDFYRALRDLDGDAEARQYRIGSEESEVVAESTSSYLNRKTSLLMLYFPLAYCVLFSVSVVRLIYDFVHPNNEPVALQALSRWFIFAQGLVDAVIYGLIEWRTKRVVRKKVRRGMLSHGGSRGSKGSGSQPAGEMTASRSEGGCQIMATMRRGLVGSRGQTSSIRAEQSTGGSASGSVVRSHPGRTSE